MDTPPEDTTDEHLADRIAEPETVKQIYRNGDSPPAAGEVSIPPQ